MSNPVLDLAAAITQVIENANLEDWQTRRALRIADDLRRDRVTNTKEREFKARMADVMQNSAEMEERSRGEGVR